MGSIKSGPHLKAVTESPLAFKHERIAQVTVVFPLPEWVPAIKILFMFFSATASGIVAYYHHRILRLKQVQFPVFAAYASALGRRNLYTFGTGKQRDNFSGAFDSDGGGDDPRRRIFFTYRRDNFRHIAAAPAYKSRVRRR
jgi:hypothetical protein